MPISNLVIAQEIRDTLRIFFHQGKTEIDPSLYDNQQKLEYIIQKGLSNEVDTVFTVRKIKVIGGASPEGSIELNRRLSELRAKCLFDYVAGHHSFLLDTLVTSVFLGRDWTGLLYLAEKDENIPYKQETLERLRCIISDINIGKEEESKVSELKQLRGGIPYRYMYINLFPKLRSSVLYIDYDIVRKFTPIINKICLPKLKCASCVFDISELKMTNPATSI